MLNPACGGRQSAVPPSIGDPLGVACFGFPPFGGSLHLAYLRFAILKHSLLRTTSFPLKQFF
jgi:hypothetical protein